MEDVKTTKLTNRPIKKTWHVKISEKNKGIGYCTWVNLSFHWQNKVKRETC